MPLVIQDRTFDAAGQLFYPPAWVPEFFGDTILVNGAPWPFFEVEPRKYRFRILNGSNSRFYNLEFADGPSFHHIGAEGRLFDAPVARRQLLVLPAERADVIVDFSRNAGDVVVLRNMSLPAGVVSLGDRMPAIMQFRVGTTVRDPGPATIPSSLPGTVPNLRPPDRTRVVTIEELMDAGGNPLRSLLDGDRFEEPVDIIVPAGSVEDWLLVNLTADSHPIHSTPHSSRSWTAGGSTWRATRQPSMWPGAPAEPGPIPTRPHI